MLRLKFYFLLSFIVVFQLQNTKAQIVNAKAEDFKEITRRPLIVQLVTEDAYLIEDLEKGISKTSMPKEKQNLKPN